jgi:hypothetical protein
MSPLFQAFPDEADNGLTFTRNRNLLILDNASWHKKKSLSGTTSNLSILPTSTLFSGSGSL